MHAILKNSSKCIPHFVGKGHFGTVQFETIHFNSTDFNRRHIVYAHKNHFTFDVGAEIGIGLKKDNKKLYLQPFIISKLF